MEYDVTVIGGGIHGVGVAQAAAARGYKTILLEQYEKLGCGTSSKSSKLIHGGLRYLEQFELKLVYECLTERKNLLNNAPHLVKLIPVYIPVYKSSKRSSLVIRLGLIVYALLGGLSHEVRFKKLKKSQWGKLHGLEKKNLIAVFQYFEAQADDQKLTQDVMYSAIKLGAELKLSAKVESVNVASTNCEVKYSNNDEHIRSLITKTVVNATGPWVNEVLSKITPPQFTVPVDCIQGTHIILPKFISKEIYYLESLIDQRPFFVMPWKGDTMIGTTETLFQESPDKTNPLDEEIEYLKDSFLHYFPEFKNEILNIKKSFSGLRVLPRNKKNANQRSRETILLRDSKDHTKLISIFGGKLTSYRATAEQVMGKLIHSLPETKTVIETKYIKLN